MVQGTTHSRYKGGSQSNYRRFLCHTKFNIPIFRNAPFSSLDKDSETQWRSMTTVLQTYHWNSDRLSHWESKQSVSGSELLVKADPFGPLVGRHMVQGTTHSRYKGGSQSNYRRFLRHKIQHPNLQKWSLLKPGQRLSDSMTLNDYCSSNISLKQWPAIALGEQAVGVWFRTACESRPFRPPSRPTYGTGHYTQSVQGRVSIKL